MTIDRARRAGGSRREQVLGDVVDVLAGRGYQQTRFRDVSEASGLAVSTLQGYFGSRDDMLIEALRQATDGEVARMQESAVTVTNPWRRLVLLVDRGLATPIPVWRMLMEFWTAAAHDEELRKHSVDLQARYREPFERTIRDGASAGVFVLAHEVGAVTDVLVAALDGLLFPRVLGQPRPDMDEFRAVLLDQLATTLGVQQ